MAYDDETLSLIFDKTDGTCRHCGKQLSWRNYGRPGERGAWEVDHGTPLSRGGTDYLRNLWPSCVGCNAEKGMWTTSEYRRHLESPRPHSNPPDLVEALATVALVGIGIALLGALLRPSDAGGRS